MKNESSEIHYICSDCAEDLNAKWPRNRLATFHAGTCQVCELQKGITHSRNWIWPESFPKKPL